MTVSSRALVELVLLGSSDDRRQLLDSPILGDVWIAYALKPTAALDLLITPNKDAPAGPVAMLIAQRLAALNVPRPANQPAEIAPLQNIVAARLTFEELFRVVVPLTTWWNDRKIQVSLKSYVTRDLFKTRIQALMSWIKAENEDDRGRAADAFSEFTIVDRYLSLAAVILWAGTQEKTLSAGEALETLDTPDPVVTLVVTALKPILTRKVTPTIWQVGLNRKAMLALSQSVPAVKGDAARRVFNVKCDKIAWAVLDSGIDARHVAFKDEDGNSRIIKTFDFTNIRQILSVDNVDTRTPEFKTRLKAVTAGSREVMSVREATGYLQNLAENMADDRPIQWELVEKFISIDPGTPPRGGHGTHVAGIIGASAARSKRNEILIGSEGMCPDIKLYDFRVISRSLLDTEFAIIAALQYIRDLNDRYNHLRIHGVNLSLSIPHDVRNFACGRTPICLECERLVANGVVVVAPAGNLGYQTFVTAHGSYEGYAAYSVTDPGNADGVITVGATHRHMPQKYGVSFFSSRGPTGDGRLKPDLVAPGERIESCLPDDEWGELDGTSMAAPHVSGAAAMLMAHYTDLIGEPQKIKRLLCDNATDLGRDRNFQGHGLLDVLRAFQKM